MRVFVTGGTGNIGQECLRQLRRYGGDLMITSLTRNRTDITLDRHRGISEVYGDLSTGVFSDSCIAAVSDADVILYFAGETSFIDASACYRVNVSGLSTFIEIVKRSNKRSMFVYTSSATSVGILPKLVVDHTPLSMVSEEHLWAYSHSKALAEAVVARELLDRHVILRPCIVISERYSWTARAILWSFASLSCFDSLPIDADGSIDIISTEDFVSVLLKLLDIGSLLDRVNSNLSMSCGSSGVFTITRIFSALQKSGVSTKLPKLIDPSDWGSCHVSQFVNTRDRRVLFGGLKYYLPYFNLGVKVDNGGMEAALGEVVPSRMGIDAFEAVVNGLHAFTKDEMLMEALDP